MGIKNAVSKSYLQDKGRFAQIWNNHGFQGEQVIRPENLRELDPEELVVRGKKMPDVGFLEKYRDILKVYEDRVILMLLGIENQDEIHYAMPLRQMLYDVLRYEEQRGRIERQHREKKDLKGEAFLSGMAREDRLLPIVSMVVYWGVDSWNGAKSLHEMLDIPPLMAQYKGIINDYRMNLLEVNALENLDAYSGELKALLGFVKYQKDKASLKSFVEANEEIFREVSPETVRAISVLGNARELESYISADDAKEKEEIDMCQALQEMIMDGKVEGKAEGKAEAVLELLSDLGEVPEELRVRILGQTDLVVLKDWLKLAAKAESVETFRNQTDKI